MKSKLSNKKTKICLYYFILFTSISYCNNFIIFPLNIKNQLNQINKEINSASSYIQFIRNNLVSTNILMGNPLKKLEAYLTSDRYDFILGEGFCSLNYDSDYNCSLSSTFEPTKSIFFSPIFINGRLSKDNIILYTDINLSQNITFPDATFIKCNPSPDYFDNINNDSFCGYIGLQISSNSDYFEWNNLINQIKSSKYINNQKWSLIFNINEGKNDGKLIIGIKEEDYYSIFNIEENDKNEYHSVYSIYTIYNYNYAMKFDEIYYSINNQNHTFTKYTQGIVSFDYDYILSNEDYFNSIKDTFFSAYFNNGICFIDKSTNKRIGKKFHNHILNIIFCDKKKFGIDDIKKFPNLNLKHIILNEIFELNYMELFEETNNYYIFKILFDEEDKSIWNFGRIFIKKYLFIFDDEHKTITYIGKNNIKDAYDKDKQKQTNNILGMNKKYFLIIIIVLIIILTGFLGLFLGKIIFNKQKKKRANELDDDYEYIEKNNSKNEGLGIKFNEND